MFDPDDDGIAAETFDWQLNYYAAQCNLRLSGPSFPTTMNNAPVDIGYTHFAPTRTDTREGQDKKRKFISFCVCTNVSNRKIYRFIPR